MSMDSCWKECLIYGGWLVPLCRCFLPWLGFPPVLRRLASQGKMYLTQHAYILLLCLSRLRTEGFCTLTVPAGAMHSATQNCTSLGSLGLGMDHNSVIQKLKQDKIHSPRNHNDPFHCQRPWASGWCLILLSFVMEHCAPIIFRHWDQFTKECLNCSFWCCSVMCVPNVIFEIVVLYFNAKDIKSQNTDGTQNTLASVNQGQRAWRTSVYCGRDSCLTACSWRDTIKLLRDDDVCSQSRKKPWCFIGCTVCEFFQNPTETLIFVAQCLHIETDFFVERSFETDLIV